MNAFVVKNILPKLGVCMQEFVINPHQQHLGKKQNQNMIFVFILQTRL